MDADPNNDLFEVDEYTEELKVCNRDQVVVERQMRPAPPP
jgi:hypothetical protein